MHIEGKFCSTFSFTGAICVGLTIDHSDIFSVDALPGSSIRATCQPGFRVDTPESDSLEVTCLQTGDWSTWLPCSS